MQRSARRGALQNHTKRYFSIMVLGFLRYVQKAEHSRIVSTSLPQATYARCVRLNPEK